VLLAAPGTPRHAAAEIERIGRDRPHATVLTGSRARVADVLAGLDGAGVAHVAAHGRFRVDDPLYSQLSLADGPLTGHDLLRLRRPPSLLVLSACDAGRAGPLMGSAPTGFAAAVLDLGARSVVASVGPVDDEATAALMVDLHRRLRAGTGPAQALAAAQVATADDPYASTYSFVCFGAD
jgi:CHAT domain-containing protein